MREMESSDQDEDSVRDDKQQTPGTQQDSSNHNSNDMIDIDNEDASNTANNVAPSSATDDDHRPTTNRALEILGSIIRNHDTFDEAKEEAEVQELVNLALQDDPPPVTQDADEYPPNSPQPKKELTEEEKMMNQIKSTIRYLQENVQQPGPGEDFTGVQDPSDAKFSVKMRHEYETLYRIFIAARRNNQGLVKKLRDMKSEIVSNATKVEAAMKIFQEDRILIASLKKEVKKAWSIVELSKDREIQAKDAVFNLKFEIENLKRELASANENSGISFGARAIGAGGGGGGGMNMVQMNMEQQKRIEELEQEKVELHHTLSNAHSDIRVLNNEIGQLKSSQQETQSQLQTALQEHEIITSLLQTKKSEQDRELRVRDKLESQVSECMNTVANKDMQLAERVVELKAMRETVARMDMQVRDEKLKVEKEVSEKQACMERVMHLEQEVEELYSQHLKHTPGGIAHANGGGADGGPAVTTELSKCREQIRLLTRARENLQKQAKSLEECKMEAEIERDGVKATNASLTREMESVKKHFDALQKQIELLTRERDAAQKNFVKATGATQRQFNAVKIATQTQRTLEHEITNFKEEASKMRKLIYALEKDRDHTTFEVNKLQEGLAVKDEELQMKEMLIFDGRKKIAELERRRKEQQQLYETVRTDRNLYSKNLIECEDEITELKRKLKIMSHQVDQLKEEIAMKEADLAKGHFENSKLEKDKEGLTIQIAKLQTQLDEAQVSIKNRMAEENKLRHVITEGDTARSKLKKEYDSIVQARDVLGSQLIRRNEEISLLYEKIKIQTSTLNKGEIQYYERIEDIRVLKLEIKKLRREKAILQSETQNVDGLRTEIFKLHRDVLKERTRVKVLEEELESPMNIHRWRKLSGSDPTMFELITKMQALQKRLIQKTEEVVEKETQLNHKDKLYQEVKGLLQRQPGPEVMEELQVLKANVKSKVRECKSLASELNMYHSQVNEFKYEIQRQSHDFQDLKKKYYELKKKDRKDRMERLRMDHQHAGLETSAIPDLQHPKIQLLKESKGAHSYVSKEVTQAILPALKPHPHGPKFSGGGFNMGAKVDGTRHNTAATMPDGKNRCRLSFMSSAPEANALQNGFVRLNRNLTLVPGISSDLTQSVFGNWLPLCPAVFSPAGDVFHALTDSEGHAKIIRYNLAEPAKLTSMPIPPVRTGEKFNVATGNLDDSNYPMASLIHSGLGVTVFLWLQDSDESPSGTFINIVSLDLGSANPILSLTSLSYLSNYQEFRPFLAAPGNLIFSLASTSTGVPCILRISLAKGASSITDCQALTKFGTNSTSTFMSLAAMDSSASRLLISADGFGYIGSWTELPDLTPISSTNSSSIGTRTNTRVRSINTSPLQKQPYTANGTIFPNFVVSTDLTSTVRFFGVPKNAATSDAWTLLWTVNPQMYPVLAGSIGGRNSSAFPVGYDDERQWVYVCAAADNRAQNDGHLLAFATYSGDVVWGGDDTGSIPCYRDSILGMNDGNGISSGARVLAASVTEGTVSLYGLTGNIERVVTEYTQKLWSLPSVARAPYAFSPRLWVASNADAGILVTDSLLVGFGGALKSGPAPVPAVDAIRPFTYENVFRPTTSHKFSVKPTATSTLPHSSNASGTALGQAGANDGSGPLSTVAIALLVAGLILFFVFIVILFVWRSNRRRDKETPFFPEDSISGQDQFARNPPQTGNSSTPSPDLLEAPSAKPSRHPSDPDMSLPHHQKLPLTAQQAPETVKESANDESPDVNSKILSSSGSAVLSNKDDLLTTKRLSYSQESSKKRNNSAFSIFFPDRLNRERRESAFSTDTVIASAPRGQPRRESSGTIASSTATIKPIGLTGVVHQSDVGSESDVTVTMSNANVQNQTLDASLLGRSAIFKPDSSKENDGTTQAKTTAIISSSSRPSAPGSIASTAFTHMEPLPPTAVLLSQSATTKAQLESQDLSTPKSNLQHSLPKQSKAGFDRPDSSLLFYSSAVEAAAAGAALRNSSTTPGETSYYSYDGYDASMPSSSMDLSSDQARVSVLSTSSADTINSRAEKPRLASSIGSNDQKAFGRRFWNSNSPPSRSSPESSIKTDRRRKVNSNTGVHQSENNPVIVKGLRSNPTLLPHELAALSADDDQTEDESVYESGASFVTAPESLYQRSLHSSGHSFSHRGNIESDAENDGYVSASSSLSTASGSKESDGYATALDDYDHNK
ncbi:hypothetical protein HDU80_008980 [Chytriomyces hyalinus]|nr:hypothetical protein HDU80_008980 [Chytriomyces hyalinus]